MLLLYAFMYYGNLRIRLKKFSYKQAPTPLAICQQFCKCFNSDKTDNLVNPLATHKGTLKLVSAIFYQIFIFHQMIALQKLCKMFFFISYKKVFSFLRYSSFCIFVFPLFSLSAIALEVDQKKKILKFMKSSTV